MLDQDVSFGVIHTFGNPVEWEQPTQTRYQQILEQAEWIDQETNIHGVYTSEHHFYDDGYLPSPLVATAAIAARTSRVQVGTNLLQLPLHNPVRLAEDALVVDAISNGRLRLGIGMGYYHQEFNGLGKNLRHRPSLMEEGVEILRHAFAGESFDYHGRRYDFDKLLVSPTPVRQGGPELWFGGFAPVAIERAARMGDGFLEFDPGAGDSYLAECERLEIPQSRRQLNVTYWAIIAEDPEKAFAQAGDHWLHLLNQYITRDAYIGRQPPLTRPFDDPREALDSGLVMLADADTAISVFERDAARGATDINIVSLMPGEPVHQETERLKYLNDKVIPHFTRSAQTLETPEENHHY